jgi:uncharacterized caspase-like protein
MARKALVVGIDNYRNVGRLHGCVNDAQAMQNVLEEHGNGDPNFDVISLLGTDDKIIEREELDEQVGKLFADDPEIALFYFAGHGSKDDRTGRGYLLCGDSKSTVDGLPLTQILDLANTSKATNCLIVLDSCYSGIAASNPLVPDASEPLRTGLTILTASTDKQYASEDNGSGLFTSLFVNAMQGAAANLIGHISPGSVYAHIDQSLGAWKQRPVFKTNVKNFVSLRRVRPPINIDELRKIAELFPSPGFVFRLDPTYEPLREKEPDPKIPKPIDSNVAKFTLLQKFNRVNLVVPVGASRPNMWDAAMESQACKLTELGEHYRRLAVDKLLKAGD